MKMGNGGFNPAYNMQIAVDTESRFIVGTDVTNKGNDFGEMPKMFMQITENYGKAPQEWLVDQGYLDHGDIIKIAKNGCKVYVHPREGKKLKTRKNQKPYEPHYGEAEELTEWRIRMGMEETKEIYKDRASNSEWANAGMRNRGLKQLLVRGINNVKSVLSLHAITHNLLRAIKLETAL
jgi:hypothetical protein